MRRLDIACLLSALAVHGVVLGLSRVAPESRLARAIADSDRGPPQEIDVEVVIEPRQRPIHPDDPIPAAYTTRPRSPLDPRFRAPALDPSLGEPLTALEPAEGEPAPAAEPWTLPPASEAYGDAPGPMGLPGLPGVPLWAHGIGSDTAGPAPAPTSVTPREIDRQAATKVLKAAQKAHDKELGLDLPAAGTIAAATAAAVRASPLPAVCRGVISVALGADGKVKSAKAIGGSGGSAGDWASVAAFVRSRLAGQTFAMPGAFSRGAIVTVSVSSNLRLPSGTAVDGPSGSIGTSGTFDVADIGADASRVVQTRFSTTPLE